jgi:hypothetical protein
MYEGGRNVRIQCRSMKITTVRRLMHYSSSLQVLCSSTDEGIQFSPIYLNLPASLGPRTYTASNRNEYQNIFVGVKHGWPLRLATSPPLASRFPKQCGIGNIEQFCKPPRYVTEIACLYLIFYYVWRQIAVW